VVVLIAAICCVQVVVAPSENPTVPPTSQSPAVREMDVTVFATVVARLTADPIGTFELTYSPIYPAAALSFVAVPRISAVVGCAATGTPAVEMLVRKLWLTAARLSTPPNVLGVGVGRRAAGTVPAIKSAALPLVAIAAKPETSADANWPTVIAPPTVDCRNT